jgi:hypothetical protein
VVRIAELRCTPICWQARSPDVRHSVDIVALLLTPARLNARSPIELAVEVP